MTKIAVTLPWPPAECSPNSRAHWANRYRAAKAYRHQGEILAKQAGAEPVPRNTRRLKVQYTFHPPRNGRYDDDNFIARMKPALDGICEAIWIDDSAASIQPVIWGDKRKPGEVVITLEAME